MWGIGYQVFMSREIYTQPLFPTYKNFARFQILILVKEKDNHKVINFFFYYSAYIGGHSSLCSILHFICQPTMSVILDFLIHCLVLDIFKLNNVCLLYLNCFIIISERNEHNQ